MFRMFAQKAVEAMPGVTAFGLGTLGVYHEAKREQEEMEEFKKKYPGEEPVVKTYMLGSYGAWTRLERAEPKEENNTNTPRL
jgi:hypothetical protein